jgi:hypothetical protein
MSRRSKKRYLRRTGANRPARYTVNPSASNSVADPPTGSVAGGTRAKRDAVRPKYAAAAAPLDT